MRAAALSALSSAALTSVLPTKVVAILSRMTHRPGGKHLFKVIRLHSSLFACFQQVCLLLRWPPARSSSSSSCYCKYPVHPPASHNNGAHTTHPALARVSKGAWLI